MSDAERALAEALRRMGGSKEEKMRRLLQMMQAGGPGRQPHPPADDDEDHSEGDHSGGEDPEAARRRAERDKKKKAFLARKRAVSGLEMLKDLVYAYTEAETFSVGDIVVWKDGLKNREIPEENRPSIVLEILPEPFYDTSVQGGQPSWREKLDIVVGAMDAGGSMYRVPVESRRLTLFNRQGNPHQKKLAKMLANYLKKSDTPIQVGDIVRWKEGMCNREAPDKYDRAIVVELLDTPILEPEEGAGSQHFREAFDMRVGLLDEDGDFVTFCRCSNRFEVDN